MFGGDRRRQWPKAKLVLISLMRQAEKHSQSRGAGRPSLAVYRASPAPAGTGPAGAVNTGNAAVQQESNQAARTSANRSGWRSSTLSNFTSASGGLVLPLSYREKALTPPPKICAASR